MHTKSKLTGGSRRPAGIKDIARALGVSTGTVDRALHSRAGINPLTRSQVLKMAEQLGYRPNLAARYLKSGRLMRVSIQLPVEIAVFFDSLREGIRAAATPFEPAVQLEFESYPRLGEGDEPLFRAALENGASGIIICPAHPQKLRPLIRRAAQKGVPVVCVASDAPDTERLAAISADPFTGGAVVGELLTWLLQGSGQIAIITGDLSTVDHAEKLRGFRSIAKTLGSGLSIASVAEAHDSEREAYRQTCAILDQNADLKGIYVSTANCMPVLRAVEDRGRARRITIVTTDLFPQLVSYLRSGVVAATMYQRPLSQGRLAFLCLYQFLTEGTAPPPRIKLAPQIIMRSNLDLFLEKIPLEAWGGEGQPEIVASGNGPGLRPELSLQK
jgi:LacI family transcriptional regulator